MMKIKEKWVSAYTSKVMHFGVMTTQHVKGAHSIMKYAIETLGSLTKAFNSLDSINIDPLLTQDNKDRLGQLLGKVSQFALNKIKNEFISITTYEACLYGQQKSALLNQLDDILTVLEVNLSNIKNVKKELTKSASFSQCISTLHIKDQCSKILLNYRIPINDIDQIYNPLSDGNCGFCTLAMAISRNKENWDLIKLVMNNQLNKRIEVYKDWLGYNTDLLKQILESRALPCESSLWFLSPDCAQLAANTFQFPLLCLTRKMNK
ncbi:12681_t:CDS:2, partial [Cetraspora pellucida]